MEQMMNWKCKQARITAFKSVIFWWERVRYGLHCSLPLKCINKTCWKRAPRAWKLKTACFKPRENQWSLGNCKRRKTNSKNQSNAFKCYKSAVGVLNITYLVDHFYVTWHLTIGNLRKHDFEWGASNESETFSLLISLDAIKLLSLSVFTLTDAIFPKDLDKTTTKECNNFTSGWRASFKNVLSNKAVFL